MNITDFMLHVIWANKMMLSSDMQVEHEDIREVNGSEYYDKR